MRTSSGISTRWLLVHSFQNELELEMLDFVWGGNPGNPEKNPWSKAENQQLTQPTYGMVLGFKLGPHWCEASTLCHACSSWILLQSSLKIMFYIEHDHKMSSIYVQMILFKLQYLGWSPWIILQSSLKILFYTEHDHEMNSIYLQMILFKQQYLG